MLWRFGDVTKTEATLLFRPEASGTITVTVGSYSDTVATGTDDTAKITVPISDTGFSATIGSESVSGTFPVMPDVSDEFSILVMSCVDPRKLFNPETSFNIYNPVAAYLIGDTPYVDISDPSGTAFGESTLAVGASGYDAMDNWYASYRKMLRNPSYQHIFENAASYFVMDDHAMMGNNWDHTVTQANTGAVLNYTLQSEVDQHWLDTTTALQLYQTDTNAINNDAGVVAQAPSEADAAAANYPPLYFRHTIGCAEIFCIDNLSHKDPLTKTDDINKTFLGSVQKAWLETALLASTATWKIIISSKKTHESGVKDNGDGMFKYSTERDEVLDYIATNGIMNVLWVAGDRHMPTAIVMQTANGRPHNHVCMTPCPSSVPYIEFEVPPNLGGIDTVNDDVVNVGHWRYSVFGYLTISPTSVKMRTVDIHGNIRWQTEITELDPVSGITFANRRTATGA